jgi:hypothetical protein
VLSNRRGEHASVPVTKSGGDDGLAALGHVTPAVRGLRRSRRLRDPVDVDPRPFVRPRHGAPGQAGGQSPPASMCLRVAVVKRAGPCTRIGRLMPPQPVLWKERPPTGAPSALGCASTAGIGHSYQREKLCH